jgi:hypothetical protein
MRAGADQLGATGLEGKGWLAPSTNRATPAARGRSNPVNSGRNLMEGRLDILTAVFEIASTNT